MNVKQILRKERFGTTSLLCKKSRREGLYSFDLRVTSAYGTAAVLPCDGRFSPSRPFTPPRRASSGPSSQRIGIFLRSFSTRTDLCKVPARIDGFLRRKDTHCCILGAENPERGVLSQPQMPFHDFSRFFHDSCVKREKTGTYRRIREESDLRVTWWALRDSNPRHFACKANALTD